ncbi:hypothetical protein ONR75_10420 [Rhodopseudomonas sp. P2A-2r]|uniref:hypothetical protein n=1 Tax=Rhodopseudomonas sp. P2A-2r TaxID=2991972 RepID=UPI002233FDEA|nr:hypothetical protein [Rhodopseudomonas sp. P2A-2r]UZE50990.1 hypothetical protein ONR75_10420 [Rhodopseudomonas sp. P2A-2r]
MQARYPNLTEKQARSNIPYPTITRDHMLAAARRHARLLKTVPLCDYEMRFFEDGSVFFRNVIQSGLENRFTLVQIQEKSRYFWLSPHRDLWQHVFWMWG